ncbi:hypothetical protein Tco_0484364 [Tanacetum coccineum]
MSPLLSYGDGLYSPKQKQFSLLWLASSSASSAYSDPLILIFYFFIYGKQIQKLRQKEVDEESRMKTYSMNWGEANSVYTSYIVSSASNGKIQAEALIFVLVGYIVKNNDDQDNDNDQDDGNERIDSDNDGDDFVYPKFSTHDKEDKDEDSFDPRVQTPSHVESTDDEDNDEEIQGANVEGDKQDKEETKDIHVIITALVNPEGQQQSFSVSYGFVSNMLNPSPDTGIDSIFNLNTESTSLVDVLVTAIAEPPLLFVTTTLPPPTPLTTHLQQTSVPTPATVPSSSPQDLPNFGSLFGIVDAYLANKMHEAVKIAVQLQSERLRDEAQAENADFINKLDDNIKKLIKNQLKEQISHAVAANLSELELKKILIDKMDSNKSIHRSNEQKNLYKAWVDSYKSDKIILDTYGDTVSFKRLRDDEDKDEEPSPGSNWGGLREEELVKNQSQPVHQRKGPPRHLASQLKGQNLITSLMASLHK